MFLKGKTPSGIAKELTEENIPTPAGKKVWCSSTVQSILQNEKYKGDALLQKSYTVDFLTKKKKINEGKVPQFTSRMELKLNKNYHKKSEPAGLKVIKP